MRLLAPVMRALHEGMSRVRRAAPETKLWLNDGADSFHPVRPEVAAEAAFRTLQRYVAFDLLHGLAVPGHETHEWLSAAGFPPEELERYAAESVPADVIGLDYYPETEHDFDLAPDGEPVITKAERPHGLAATALAYHQRYGVPLFVAESSASGSDEVRRGWLEWNLGQIEEAAAGGAEVLGYTWWPLFDHIDWNTLLVERTGFVCPAGLFHLTPTTSDRLRTDAADTFAALARSAGEGAATRATASVAAASKEGNP